MEWRFAASARTDALRGQRDGDGGKRSRSGFVGWRAEFVKRFVAFVEFAFLRDAEFAKFLP